MRAWLALRRCLAGSALVTALFGAVACGKSPMNELAPSARWDAPTPENGFHPEACGSVDAAGKIHDSAVGSLEEIAAGADRLATDPQHVYFVTGGREIHRAERATAPWPKPWREETIATSEHGDIVDLAVSDARIYWVVDEGGAGAAQPGPQRLYSADKSSLERTLVNTFPRPISKLFASKSGVAFSSPRGVEQIDDTGAITMPPGREDGRVVGATDDEAFVFLRAGFIAAYPRRPWTMTRTIAAANDVVIASAADSSFIYWLERGGEAEQGKLRRVARAGGTPVDLFTGIPNAESLALAKGIVWITTAHGLLRYDPSCHFSPVRVAGASGIHGRAAAFGEGLAVLAEKPSPRVALFGAP